MKNTILFLLLSVLALGCHTKSAPQEPRPPWETTDPVSELIFSFERRCSWATETAKEVLSWEVVYENITSDGKSFLTRKAPAPLAEMITMVYTIHLSSKSGKGLPFYVYIESARGSIILIDYEILKLASTNTPQSEALEAVKGNQFCIAAKDI